MTEAELSVATSFDYTLPIEAQLPLIAEAGFTHVSLGALEPHSTYLSQLGRQRLRALLSQTGLRLDSIHGPRADQPNADRALMEVAHSAAELSVPVVVIHGSPFDFPEGELSIRLGGLLATCRSLEKVSRDMVVRFALENLLPGPATDLVRAMLPRLDPEHFGFCYDSAHDQIGGPRPPGLLVDLTDRVVAVHLSDRVAEFVDHVVPGEGFIDWAEVGRALRASTYGGPITLEVMTTHSAEKEPRRFLELAYRLGRWLSSLVGRGTTQS